MYKNIKLSSITNRINTIIALKSIVISMDSKEAAEAVDRTPGVIMRGVYSPHAKLIKEALEKVGAKVELT